MSTPTHDTRHAVFSRYFVQHRLLIQVDGGVFECAYCQCPHIEMPGVQGMLHIVATKAVRCDESFVIPCPECGQVYQCAADCEFVNMLALLEALAAKGYELADD